MGGLNRSGATLLGSLLNQNPEIHVNVTSPLVDLCLRSEMLLNELNEQYTFHFKELHDDLLTDFPKLYFKRFNQKYIIDNGRSWPGNISEIKKFIDPNPKVICTYRPLPEVITSFLALDRQNKDNAARFSCEKLQLEINTKNLADVIWNVMTKGSWESLRKGLQLNPEYILLINYHDLVDDPKAQVDRIYNFLDIPKFEHHFEKFTNTLKDPKDYKWGFHNLHTIRTDSVSKVSLDPKEVLGEELFEYYSKFDKLLFEGVDESRLRR